MRQIKLDQKQVDAKKYIPYHRVKLLTLNFVKRAERALGRSPEEEVKGHSGDISRGPLMLSTKYW